MDKIELLPSFLTGSHDKLSAAWIPWSLNSTNYCDESEIVRDAQHDEKQGVLLKQDSAPSYITSIITKTWEYSISLLSLLWILLPRRGRPVRQKALHQLHPLAYLDALRGYFAMIIYTTHAMPKHWRWLPQPVLDNPWTQFPFRGGFASLGIFFWISGYVLTYKMIGLMQTRKFDKFLDTLTSSMFRRYPRLFLPVIGVTFVTIMLAKAGVVIPPPHKAKDLSGNPLMFWVKDSIHALDPFAHVNGWYVKKRTSGTTLLDQFWSINTEFRSSMMLYCFCAATCKMSSGKRKLVIWCMISALMYWEVNYAAMAMLGVWFGECRQAKMRELEEKNSLIMVAPIPIKSESPNKQNQNDNNNNNKNDRSPSPIPQINRAIKSLQLAGKWRPSFDYAGHLSRLRTPALLLMFICSFVVMKSPHTMSHSTEFPNNLFKPFTPKHFSPEMKMYLQLCIGAFMMLYPLDQIPRLQRPLLSPFSQYLGELSFGIYAVHYSVFWFVWQPRYLKWAEQVYGEKEFDYFSIVFPGYVLMTIVLLWTADLFRRFDVQVVKLCRNLEAWAFG